ncbi:hypothetical protein MPL1032_250074 [Mesorhizobium plurifarium]|uniref:Uncharacterized protein n=1 Tax=Mesorhizobium plurifarium TaxID=69974 RepID=A0A0K2W1Y1_MESPL|nr:hypothetical protein MPL1032_250074 [Mesorhizobium plurifarium]
MAASWSSPATDHPIHPPCYENSIPGPRKVMLGSRIQGGGVVGQRRTIGVRPRHFPR